MPYRETMQKKVDKPNPKIKAEAKVPVSGAEGVQMTWQGKAKANTK